LRLLDADRELSLGVALSKTFLLTSSATRQDTCVDTTATGCDVNASPAIPFQAPTLTSFDVKRKYPVRAPSALPILPAAVCLFQRCYLSYRGRGSVFAIKWATLDAALGAEYYLNKKWAVRAGVFSNVANTPEIQAGVTNIEEHINLTAAA